ncbi:MAG: ABC transporter substrate-binding protein, partial [Lachnospiraceae bacterium]|nr:ABC transporter substrate-binding protein [Lachnospiraceae bacterium]
QGVTSANQEITEETEKTYSVDITFDGGSGKAYINSPVEVTEKDGKYTATFIWSSENYDYMIVEGTRYDNENPGGPSTFSVEVPGVTEPLTVIGDTTAMSAPHEIEYVITWGEKGESENGGREGSARGSSDKAAMEKALESAGLSKTGETAPKIATGFSIEQYGDYDLISIENSGDYLVVPEGRDIPEGLPEELIILKQPLDNTYLVSSAAMDPVIACGAIDMIRLSGIKEEDWYLDEAKDAMKKGQILYAGKYRAPDYELILEKGCDLAIENTMIYHDPDVKAKLTELGIPVLVENSSYEEHPLGRLEWIKLYGALYDKEEEANDYFEKELKSLEPLLNEKPDTGKTVVFFYVTSNGLINVRKNGDYITKMIELSGGRYALENAIDSESGMSTMNMQMEDFYTQAADADILIYNSTIGGEISSLSELIKMNSLFKDFKAVKDGRVYCTERNFFQQITGMADFMKDLNDVFNNVDRDYTYLIKLRQDDDQ